MDSVANTERAARKELNRDMRLALKTGQSVEQLRAARNRAIEDWTRWLYEKMDQLAADDPVEILPHALEYLERRAAIAAARVAKTMARNEVKRALQKALE